MRTRRTNLFIVIVAILLLSSLPGISQIKTVSYKIPPDEYKSVLIENGKLYRITIKSCWYSADAYIGTYLIYGLNVSDPKTNGKLKVLVVAETEQIDWYFRYRLTGQYDTRMEIISQGKGDQGLLVVVEELSAD